MTPAKSSSWFTRFAKNIAHATGQPVTFALAVFVVLAWGISGPLFHFSDTWQLVINTGTTIVTFLMVFLIQHTANNDMRAVQLKLNELIAALDGAANRLIDVEDLSEEELADLHDRFRRLAREAKSDKTGAKLSVDSSSENAPVRKKRRA